MICMDINTRVRQRRIEMGLSQADLAQTVGVKQQNIQQLEDGTVSRPRYMHELANALNVDLGWLLTGQTQRAGENPTTVVADATTGSLATTTPTARTVIERIIHAASTGELNDEAMKAIGKAAEQMRKPPQVSANDYPYIPTAHDP